MSKSRFILLIAFVLLVAMPAAAALAQEIELISAGEATAVIADDELLSDSLVFSMTGVTAPEAGTAYEGWLISDDDSIAVTTGILEVDDDGNINHTFSSPTGENLIRNFGKVAITIEPVPDDDPGSSGVVAFQDRIPSGGMKHVRHLVADWADSGKGIITRLEEQLKATWDEAKSATSASAFDDLKRRMERIVNAIEGPDGPNYGDLDGDGTVEEVGDGIGVLPHAAEAIAHAGFAIEDSGNDPTVTAHALLVELDAQSSIIFATQARDKAIEDILGVEDVLALNAFLMAKLRAGSVAGLLESALRGVDANEDGEIASVLGEAGAEQAYVEAQRMATYSLVTAELAPTPTATPTPTPEVETPATGDTSVPILAKLGLAAAAVFLALGGLLFVSGRRSRSTA